MFEMAAGWGWLALAYVAGTGFGLWYKQTSTVEKTIDSLIDNGYLKYRKKSNGDIDILKKHETE
jgi:hypothetical protein